MTPKRLTNIGAGGPKPTDALYHAGRMSNALDRLTAAFAYRHGPDPDAAGKAVVDLLTAKRDYDRAIVDAVKDGGR